MKKLAVKFEGNEIMSVDNFDVFGKLSQKSEILSIKVLSPMTGARKTALN